MPSSAKPWAPVLFATAHAPLADIPHDYLAVVRCQHFTPSPVTAEANSQEAGLAALPARLLQELLSVVRRCVQAFVNDLWAVGLPFGAALL